MAHPDDISASITPKILIIVTAIAMFVRLGVQAYDFVQPQPPQVSAVKWNDSETFKYDPLTMKDKPVMYEFYASWSDPCKTMDQTSLANKQVGKLIQENFIPIRVVDQLREKGKNPQYITDLHKRYRVFAFPTFVVVKPDGEVESTLVGNCSSLTTYRFVSRLVHKKS